MNETTAKGKNLTDKKGKQAIMNPKASRDRCGGAHPRIVTFG